MEWDAHMQVIEDNDARYINYALLTTRCPSLLECAMAQRAVEQMRENQRYGRDTFWGVEIPHGWTAKVIPHPHG